MRQSIKPVNGARQSKASERMDLAKLSPDPSVCKGGRHWRMEDGGDFSQSPSDLACSSPAAIVTLAGAGERWW